MIPAELQKFLEAAKSQGATEQEIVGLLRGRGWPEDEVYRALADHYEVRSGLQIPVYKRSGSAKDAFLYLVSFATLATWTWGVGSVMFVLIDHWIKDPLRPAYSYGFYQLADSLASIIVAFPIYLFVMRYIGQEVGRHPEKLESSVRKWLTSIALFITASIGVGDLIALLTYLLRGELTANFFGKAAVILVVVGGIFWYYVGVLQQKPLLSKNTHE